MRLIGPLARIVFSGCVSAGLRTEGLDNWADHWLAPSWEKSYIYLLILQSCWRMLMFEKSSVSLKKTQPTKKPTKHKKSQWLRNCEGKCKRASEIELLLNRSLCIFPSCSSWDTGQLLQLMVVYLQRNWELAPSLFHEDAETISSRAVILSFKKTQTGKFS